MKDKSKNNDGFFKVSVKDLMIQIFKQGKETSFKDGAVAALNDVGTNLGVIASLTKNRNITLIIIDINVITSLLVVSRNKFIKRIAKEELQMARPEENLDLFLNMIDSIEDFDDVIEDDFIQGQNILEVMTPIIEILPSDEKESIILDICISIQSGFNRAVYEELPKLMENFYENILQALEVESYETIKNIIEGEKLTWYSNGFGYP